MGGKLIKEYEIVKTPSGRILDQEIYYIEI